MNFVLVICLLINIVLILSLPRRAVLLPILVSGILLPMGPRIDVSGLDFTAFRIVLIFGWIRLIFKKSEFHSMKYNNIDKFVCIFVLSTIVAYSLLWQTMGAFIYRLGVAYYILGIYFLVRFYIIDNNDIKLIVNFLAYLTIIIFFFVVIERISYHNYFSYLGGNSYTTMIRDGKLRCFGSFAHPISLGCFGAFMFPLSFYISWQEKGNKKLGIVGMISSITITLFSNSSGPLIGLIASAVGLSTWTLRKHMRVIQWGILFTTVVLHLIMNGPVWAIIDRVGVFTGSQGYYRFLLLDQFIRRFNEWWLIGVKSIKHWDEFLQFGDVTNNYVRTGVDGGIISLTLFIVIIVLCFHHIGRAVKFSIDKIENKKIFWTLGASMLSYVVSFVDVSLWDQTIVIWYLLIATISSIKSFSCQHTILGE